MQDQVKQLQSKDIPAIVLGDNGESIEALLMYYNQPLIAYLTLEYLFGTVFCSTTAHFEAASQY